MKRLSIVLMLLCATVSAQTKIYNQPVKYRITPNLSVVDSILTKASSDLLTATSVEDFKTQIGLSDYLPLTGGTLTGDLTITSLNNSKLTINDETNNSYYEVMADNFSVIIDSEFRQFYSSGAGGIAMTINTNGNVGFGGITNPLSYAVEVNGAVMADNFIGDWEGGIINNETTYNRTIAEIDASPNNGLVTKEWVQNNTVLPVDFYEEGTFTPALVDQGGGATYTSLTSTGVYVRVGNSVTYSLEFSSVNTSGTPNGNVIIDNLPFAQTLNHEGHHNVSIQAGDVTFSSIKGIGLQNSTSVFLTIGNGSVGNRSSYSSVTFSSGIVKLSGTYITNVYTP